ncbi:MAG: SDR family NAD(P)-dependent oxidoreductase, partial [Bacteroidota bacterium]
MNKKILVTGGLGYIGSHTMVDLIKKGFDVVCVDNLSRGDKRLLKGVEQIVQKKVKHYTIDLCDEAALKQLFKKEKAFGG